MFLEIMLILVSDKSFHLVLPHSAYVLFRFTALCAYGQNIIAFMKTVLLDIHQNDFYFLVKQ